MKRHGAEAPIHAAMHPDAMLDKGVQQRFCLLRLMMKLRPQIAPACDLVYAHGDSQHPCPAPTRQHTPQHG